MKYFTLKKGDIVDIVFPASCCTYKQVIKINSYIKQELNLTPRILQKNQINIKNFCIDNEFPCSSIDARCKQLHQALSNQESRAVWCIRGGYGSGDLLPYLSQLKPIKQNKLFIGFSDITSINIFLQQKWNWHILYAQTLLQITNKEINKNSKKELQELLFSNKLSLNYSLILLNRSITKNIVSQLTGGCASVIISHFGGQFEINFNKKILFLEDEGESGERLDRYFRQITEKILKNKEYPSSIILGNFKKNNSHGMAKNTDLAIIQLIKRFNYHKINIPIFQTKNNDLGHGINMRTVVIGAKAIISNNLLKIRY